MVEGSATPVADVTSSAFTALVLVLATFALYLAYSLYQRSSGRAKASLARRPAPRSAADCSSPDCVRCQRYDAVRAEQNLSCKNFQSLTVLRGWNASLRACATTVVWCPQMEREGGPAGSNRRRPCCACLGFVPSPGGLRRANLCAICDDWSGSGSRWLGSAQLFMGARKRAMEAR